MTFHEHRWVTFDRIDENYVKINYSSFVHCKNHSQINPFKTNLITVYNIVANDDHGHFIDPKKEFKLQKFIL